MSNEHEAAQDAVIENQIDLVVVVGEGNAVLPPDEGKTFAQFQQELLQMVAEQGFELCFGNLPGLGYLEKFKDIGFAQEIGGRFDKLAFGGQLEDARLVTVGGQAQEKGTFFLAHQFAHRPALAGALLFIEAALQRIVDLQQLDHVRPA